MSQKLPEDEFLKTFKNAPRIACNVIIEDSDGKLLLTKRGKPPCVGQWHYPGSFLRKDETIDACLKRIANEELGIFLLENKKLLGVFENISGDPRGHVVDVLYKYISEETSKIKPIGDTKEVEFFRTLPANVGFGQKKILERIGYH